MSKGDVSVIGGAMGRRLLAWLAFLAMAGTASALPAATQDDLYGLSGTVGGHPVAMVVTVRDRDRVVAAHYSYASQKKQIPLATAVAASSVSLTEPGGARFDLHLVGPATQDGRPLTFYTSVGLVGTWVDGARRLPVKLTLEFAGAGPAVQDCVLYPDPPAPRGVHFPNPGCEHTPDKATLDACVKAPFTTAKAATECLDRAGRTCRSDQMDMNFCAGNLDAYLDQTVERRLRGGAGPMTARAYQRWEAAADARCKRDSAFSPEGSGHAADITLCLAGGRLSLLQNGLKPPVEPIRR